MRSRMMNATGVLCGAGLALTLAAAPAIAQLPQPPLTVADRPAATLLLPYFEVDLANPAGPNTFFSVNNASASAVLAHVTIWSALHVPVHSFDMYLTGYDVQQLNVRELLSGVLPRTASVGQDPDDVISPQGVFSQDINFASCNSGGGAELPPATLPQATVDHIRNALTGQPSAVAGGMCATIPDGTRIARGYITVDTVNQCSLLTPANPGYFGVVATNQNVLWGDYQQTNHLGGLDSGDGAPLVHIYADASDPETSTVGEYTFYGRLVNWTAADNREPLSTVFGARYVLGNAAIARTELIVWRDAKVNQPFFPCANRPAWYPLSHEQIVFFDEQERVQSFTISSSFSPPPPNVSVPFPAGTQRVQVGGADLPVPFQFGWIYLNLNTTVAASINPPEDPTAAQAFVIVHQKGVGKYSVGWAATMFDTAKERSQTFLPIF